VDWLRWIKDSQRDNPEQIQEKLETNFAKHYWEMINPTFGCFGQTMDNDLVTQSSVII